MGEKENIVHFLDNIKKLSEQESIQVEETSFCLNCDFFDFYNYSDNGINFIS